MGMEDSADDSGQPPELRISTKVDRRTALKTGFALVSSTVLPGGMVKAAAPMLSTIVPYCAVLSSLFIGLKTPHNMSNFEPKNIGNTIAVALINCVKNKDKPEQLLGAKRRFLELLRATGEQMGQAAANHILQRNKIAALARQAKENPDASDETRALSKLMKAVSSFNDEVIPEGYSDSEECWDKMSLVANQLATQLGGGKPEEYDRDHPLTDTMYTMISNIAEDPKYFDKRSVEGTFIDPSHFCCYEDWITYYTNKWIKEKNPSFVTVKSLVGELTKIFGEDWGQLFRDTIQDSFYNVVPRPKEQREEADIEPEELPPMPHHDDP